MANSKWTNEQAELALSEYDPENSEGSLKELMAKLPDKTRRQIIAKLTHGKVYKAPPKPERKTPVDEGPTVKELLAEISEMGFNPENFAGTKKAGILELRDLVRKVQGS